MFLLPLSLPPWLHFPFLVTSYYPAVVNFIPRDRTKERRWYQTVFARLLLHSGAFWHQRISGHATPPSPSLDRPLFARGKSYFLTLPPWNTRYEKFVRATRPFLLWKKGRKSGFQFWKFLFPSASIVIWGALESTELRVWWDIWEVALSC